MQDAATAWLWSMRNRYIKPHLTIPTGCIRKNTNRPNAHIFARMRVVRQLQCFGEWELSVQNGSKHIQSRPTTLSLWKWIEPAHYPQGLWMAAFPARITINERVVPKIIQEKLCISSGDFPHSCIECWERAALRAWNCDSGPSVGVQFVYIECMYFSCAY